LLIVSRVSS
ncbi:hypothetical protein CP8484711_2247B, partial [Chlamydia psittaci 84-8471/1]